MSCPKIFRMWACCLLFILLHSSRGFSGIPFFSTLSIKDGLPSSIIAAVAQDEKGFIWIGTGNGLARYDGYRFRAFRKEESPSSLPSNQISSLLSDGEFIWVGTWNGLCKINTITFEVTRIDLGEHQVVRVLYKDPQNTIWIGTATGLIRFVDQKNYEVFTAQNSGLSHNTVRSIFMDDQNNLWAGTYDKLNKLENGKITFTSFDLKGSYKPSLKNNLICDIQPHSSDSLLWIGTETGLCLFNVRTGTYQHFMEKNTSFSNEVIKSIYVASDHQLWLGTDFGLNVFNPNDLSNAAYFHNPQQSHSIANNVVWQIFEDKGNVLWFVTSNGISKLNRHPAAYEYHEVSYRIHDQVIGNQVKAALITKRGVLWLATLHGAIRYDRSKNEKKLFDTNSPASQKILLNNVFALEEDDHERIWIGTAGGINIWDERNQKMFSITSNATNGLTSNYIARFTKCTDGSFWVSAWEGGLYKVTGNFNDLNSIRFELAGDFGSEKSAAGANAIWIVKDNELFKIDLKTYRSEHIQSFSVSASKKDLHCLYYSRSGLLWAGTSNGLIEYNPEKKQTTFHPVVTGEYINFGTITEDNYGNIWATGNGALLKFVPAGRAIEIFPLDKDLPLKSFLNGCVTSSNDGEIIFGGDNGYISLQPADARPNSYQSPVYITALEINNKMVNTDEEIEGKILLKNDVSFTNELILNYAQRSITFEFASLHYWQPSASIYAYKLEGFDKDWNYVSGQKNFAVYSNLSPKEYILRVRGTNNYGVWSNQESAIRIKVKPPIFLSTVFITLYVFIVLAVLIIAFRIYTARIHLRNELRIARLEKEHAEEIAQTKQQFFTNISHELRTPISLILPPIRQILKQGNLDSENKKLIALAEKNSQRLLRLVSQILDFRKLESDSLPLKIISFDIIHFVRELHSLFSDKAVRNDIDFTFHSSINSCWLWADAEKIETVLFNLLSNAFKFTPKGGTVHVAINQVNTRKDFENGAIEIRVKDSGIGIPKEELPKVFERFYQTEQAKQMEGGYGIGLTLAAEYTKLHHGDIAVESDPGKGTCFTVLLPLGNSHFPVDLIHEDEELNLVATRSNHAADEKSKPYRFDLQSGKPLVLVVENNLDLIDFIKISLKEKYNFFTAENGEEALQKVHSFSPEIIISDIMMPVMDGITFCRKVKESSRTAHIPIILLTARSLTSQNVEGIRVGADSYLTKPFEIELLEAHVDHLLTRKKELINYFRHELLLSPKEKTHMNGDELFIDKVMSIIEANISDPEFGVDALSKEVGMSATHLYRKLKSLTHLTANDVIKKYRIKKASLLLKNKAGNISEIMHDVGFSSLSYFSKCFKTEYGLSPKEYQQKMGNGVTELEDKLRAKISSTDVKFI